MAGKLAWTGKLTAKAGSASLAPPSPTSSSIALRKYSGQYPDAVLIALELRGTSSHVGVGMQSINGYKSSHGRAPGRHGQPTRLIECQLLSRRAPELRFRSPPCHQLERRRSMLAGPLRVVTRY
jgi:hypothetical protein